MARPLRIEFAGALYHVTARGNAQQNIYKDDNEKNQWGQYRLKYSPIAITLLQEIKSKYESNTWHDSLDS